MNTSYMRFWMPSQMEQQSIALTLNSIACFVTYPLEYVKTRIQIRAEGYGIRQYSTMAGYNGHKIFRQIHEAGGGMERFYRGFVPHYISKVSSLWIRNWVYYKTYYRAAPVKPTNDLTWKEKAVIGAFAGAVGAFFTSPIEMISVRMVNDDAIPKEMRRNYSSIGDALGKIQKMGGVKALWAGCGGYMAKMAMLNASMTFPYDFINEEFYMIFGEYEARRVLALIAAAASGTFFSLPFDTVRTRMMKMSHDPSLNRINYSSSLDCFSNMMKHESVASLWVGATPYFYRTLFYCAFTVYASETMTDPLKRKAGLKEYEIYPE